MNFYSKIERKLQILGCIFLDASFNIFLFFGQKWENWGMLPGSFIIAVITELNVDI